METIVPQWYEVKRRDGVLQYATKTDAGYLLYGSGFLIREFDAESVTPVDKVPKRYVEGIAHFEHELSFKAVCDLNERWNGWYKPFIHHSQIKKLVKHMQWDIFSCSLDDNGNFLYTDEEESGTIAPKLINGDLYYNLGEMGWTWEFKIKK